MFTAALALDGVEIERVGQPDDRQRAVDRGLARARHRCVGERRGAALELGIEPPRQACRRGAEVDHRPAELGLGREPALAQADLLDLLAARQGEHDGPAFGRDLVDRERARVSEHPHGPEQPVQASLERESTPVPTAQVTPVPPMPQ
jgi:hypothetical protein